MLIGLAIYLAIGFILSCSITILAVKHNQPEVNGTLREFAVAFFGIMFLYPLYVVKAIIRSFN
jgi:hypothetical protein